MVLTLWREIAEPAGLPKVLQLDAKRRTHLKARLKEKGWLDHFQEAITYAARHPEGAWMRGEGTDAELLQMEVDPAYRQQIEEVTARKPFMEAARAAFDFFGGLMTSLGGSLTSSTATAVTKTDDPGMSPGASLSAGS